MIHNIPQPMLEEYFTALISDDDNVLLRKGVSFVSLEQVRFASFTPTKANNYRLMVELSPPLRSVQLEKRSAFDPAILLLAMV